MLAQIWICATWICTCTMRSSSIPSTSTTSTVTRRLNRKWEIATDELHEAEEQVQGSKELERTTWAEYQNSERLDVDAQNTWLRRTKGEAKGKDKGIGKAKCKDKGKDNGEGDDEDFQPARLTPFPEWWFKYQDKSYQNQDQVPIHYA